MKVGVTGMETKSGPQIKSRRGKERNMEEYFRREISLAGVRGETIPGRRSDVLPRRVAPLCYRLQYRRGPYCDLEVSISKTSLSRRIRQSVLRPPLHYLLPAPLVSTTPRSEPPPFDPTSARQPLCSLLITLLYHPNLVPGPAPGLGYGLNTVDRDGTVSSGCTKTFTDCQSRKLANSSATSFAH